MRYLLIISLLVLAGCAPAQQIPSEDTTAKDAAGEVRTFTLTAENYKFLLDGKEAPEIRVSIGDTVRIELTSREGFHNWGVDEFNAFTGNINAGGTSSVEFTADEKGSFEYYCSIGNHRQFGMKGILLVE